MIHNHCYSDQLRQRLIAEREDHQQEQARLQARIRELEQYIEVQGRRLRRSRAATIDQDIDSGDEGIRRVDEMRFDSIDEADDEASSEASVF